MVDAEDLKSFGHCDRVGSSPTIPTTNFHRSEARAENWVSRRSDSEYGQKHYNRKARFFIKFLDVWLSWLEHYVHIVGVGGSSPPTSTKNKNGRFALFLFLWSLHP